ncbi:MAG TPA: hypothetical protein PKE65_01030 [Rhizobiaceae bacterium]|nr:hypothetical protein [Rhizobiaceae bacterium]
MFRNLTKTTVALALSVAFLASASAAHAASAQKPAGANARAPLVLVQQRKSALRKIAPGRAKLVPQSQQLKAAGGTTAATCCTHWNTSTGGTGCATYEGSCPSNTFEVECGATGCW